MARRACHRNAERHVPLNPLHTLVIVCVQLVLQCGQCVEMNSPTLGWPATVAWCDALHFWHVTVTLGMFRAALEKSGARRVDVGSNLDTKKKTCTCGLA